MANKLETALIEANAILAAAEPLIAVVSIVVRSVAALLRAQGQGDAAASFEQELATYEAQRQSLRAALDAFHAKYPKATAKPGV